MKPVSWLDSTFVSACACHFSLCVCRMKPARRGFQKGTSENRWVHTNLLLTGYVSCSSESWWALSFCLFCSLVLCFVQLCLLTVGALVGSQLVITEAHPGSRDKIATPFLLRTVLPDHLRLNLYMFWLRIPPSSYVSSFCQSSLPKWCSLCHG